MGAKSAKTLMFFEFFVNNQQHKNDISVNTHLVIFKYSFPKMLKKETPKYTD